ncbi:MAG: hypothetical protein COW19_07065 [Zetaproteobacteria bacterium CG12_big_fil_rev_8_21_14_0_65_55_1124]|nr:MAG: hypothetical protein AUJ58_02665 [Zetaproteobacteria bacterium CG1_02_55_237]PIS19574.1 MAG: hypothetical protein COT53_05150 [Zetaproteobacteria bacterium CG08_land_8_20_14_0_20_55_17]PIW42665.1 MAG: hypothetical protein COW19_07065 [Zetaproteobacteria bacterium CG12_big_fil_rev_8_21_14_0_65_55_1124]PIY52032.1 MAG: hypothetical protein COZ01_09240 [Zetaproteobacteria bacterium CG_4_10_14_0_8_um_filter_55_43]PIZ38956.1 MAG: hypothetical protein COY36_04500 [Zetaproteobacteria bacterium 
MKKMIFSAAAFGLVAVSSIALAPTTAEAIPAFARQTGAACLSCHFQTFPAINAFGRSFKKNSFTDVGDQALVEDDNMSIPAVLNATVVIRGNYTNTKTALGSAGVWSVPSETPILIAGRIGSNSGAFVEFANSMTGSVTVGNWQLVNSFDVGGFKVGVGAHNSSFGASAVMETSNVFGQHGGKLAGSDVSAVQASGFRANIIGVGAWAGNDMADVQFALVAPTGAQGTNVGIKLAKLVRAHVNLDLGGFDSMIGVGFVTGQAGKLVATPGPVAGAGVFNMNLQFVDFQAQGDIGDTSLGIYADIAQAKGKTTANAATNFFGGAAQAGKWDAWGLRAEVKPLHNIGFGVGLRSINSDPTGLAKTKTNRTHLAAFYEIYQNFELNLVYNNDKATLAGVSTTTKSTMLEFEALM